MNPGNTWISPNGNGDSDNAINSGHEHMPALKTPDGNLIDVYINNDVRLYRAPGGNAGIDIYIHKAQSGIVYYYTYAWSILNPAAYSIITPDEAQDRLTRIATLTEGIRLTDDEAKLAEQFFPGIFDEDA